MRALRRVALAAAAAGVGAVVVAAALVLWSPAGGGSPATAGPITVTTELEPRFVSIGDPVTARAVLRVDPAHVDPRSIRLRTDFRPYEVVDEQRSIVRRDGVAVVTITAELDCFGLVCLPDGQRAVVHHPGASVDYRFDGGPARLPVVWPALTYSARLTKATAGRTELAAGLPQDGPPVFRMSPRLLGRLLVALAVLLASGGAAAIILALRPVLARRRRSQDPLELLLAQLAAATRSGDQARRRRTLEDLAVQLEPLDRPLSIEGRVLAWGPDDPSEAAVDELSRHVRRLVVS